MDADNRRYKRLCAYVMRTLGKDEIYRLMTWEFCELDPTFLGQYFCEMLLPRLLAAGLDIARIFVICSAVPDRTLLPLVQQYFKYYRWCYPGVQTVENLP